MEESGRIFVESDSTQEERPGYKRRETWDGKLDFLIACVGTSVGLGNVWRFPYLCYKNGGGAFLIPYFLSVVVAGIPLFFLEVAVGQFMSRGGPQTWNMVPLFQGIGVATTIIVFGFNCYYNMILAWAFYYMFSSFTSDLPWNSCGHDWNTQRCVDNVNGQSIQTGDGKNLTDPVTEFWEHKVLSISEGLDVLGKVKCDMLLCLLLTWILVFAGICKGIRITGKVMYVTATSPYLFMFILLIRNCTLDGSSDGIEYYLKPNMTKLTESMVWVDAGTQIIFSWGVGLGVLTVLGSYNKFHHNSLRDALAFSVVNACSSFLAGFIVFAILGFMAKQQNVLVSDVAESGPGLAFIAYPKAVLQLPFSPLWSILFFTMVVLLGLDSQFASVESFVTAIVDQYPHLLRTGYRREIFIGLMCTLMFLVGLPMVTEGGMYVFQLFDYYTGSRFLLLVAFFEAVAVCYCYGVRRFTDNVRMMIGDTGLSCMLPYFQITWSFFAPVFCLIMFAFGTYNYSELTYKRPHYPEYRFPDWGVAIGWTMATVGIIWIPLVAIYKITRLVWMGGHLIRDIQLLLVPYSLKKHQRRSQDEHVRCLSHFEQSRKREYCAVHEPENADLTIF